MKKIFILLFIFTLLFGFSSLTFAAKIDKGGTESGCTEDGCRLTNPLTGDDTSIDPQILIGKVIQALLGLTGSIALVMFIYGGFTWMTAAGNAESVTKGKNILIWATVGLVVIFSAYGMVKFIFTSLGV